MQVIYVDGETEDLWLMGGLEHVRVQLAVQHKHELPSPEELHTLSQTLLQQSNMLESSAGLPVDIHNQFEDNGYV